jgi:hypothetical protein
MTRVSKFKESSNFLEAEAAGELLASATTAAGHAAHAAAEGMEATASSTSGAATHAAEHAKEHFGVDLDAASHPAAEATTAAKHVGGIDEVFARVVACAFPEKLLEMVILGD